MTGAPIALQRSELYVSGGGHPSSVDGPGTNEAKAVAIVQDRMIALGVLTRADAGADRASMKARKGRIMAADITHTTDAIPKCDTPALSAPATRSSLSTLFAVLRNSAEWCLAGKSKLFCTTKTHDSAARVKAAHQPRTFEAVFGHPLGAVTEAQVPYLRKLKGETTFDNLNVLIQPPEGGSQRGADILFEDPAFSGESYFLDTIRHEVQHAADHSGGGDQGSYQTEVNARWIETRFAGFSTHRQVHRMGHTWNERQFAAFYDMWAAPDLYPFLRTNWNQADAGKRAAWRSMVVGYTLPVTANPINSVRIENLTVAVGACSQADCDAHDAFLHGTGTDNAKAKAVKDAIGALDPLDRSTIPGIASLKSDANAHLKGSLKTDFDAIH